MEKHHQTMPQIHSTKERNCGERRSADRHWLPDQDAIVVIALVLRDVLHDSGDIDSATATTALTVHIQSGTGAMDIGGFTVHNAMGTPWIALGHHVCILVPVSNHPALWERQVVALVAGACNTRIGAIQGTVPVSLVNHELPGNVRRHPERQNASRKHVTNFKDLLPHPSTPFHTFQAKLAEQEPKNNLQKQVDVQCNLSLAPSCAGCASPGPCTMGSKRSDGIKP